LTSNIVKTATRVKLGHANLHNLVLKSIANTQLICYNDITKNQNFPENKFEYLESL